MTLTQDPAVSADRRSLVVDILKKLPANIILYGSALLALAAIPGAELAGPLTVLAGGLGVEALGTLLDRLTDGEQVSAAEIEEAITRAIADSDIANRLKTTEFQRALGRLLHQQHLIRAAVEKSEYALVDQLASQYAGHQALLF